MSALLISPQEYLQSDFEPDADYVDGPIEERPVGEYSHSTWQAAILAWFQQHAREWNIRARPILRLHVSSTRYRVPDVAILDRNQPTEPVLTTSPLAVFEILSPEDRIKRLLIELEDYRLMGIRDIVVIDPEDGRFYRYSNGSFDLVEEPVLHFGIGSMSLDRDAVQQLLD